MSVAETGKFFELVFSTIICFFQERTDEKPLLYETYSMKSTHEYPLSRKSNTKRSLSQESNNQSGSDSFPISKRQRVMQDLLTTKKEKDEAFSIIKNRSNRRDNEREANECDLYGQLLAEKLKPLSVDDRLVLMNEIDNLVFKFIMNVRKESS